MRTKNLDFRLIQTKLEPKKFIDNKIPDNYKCDKNIKQNKFNSNKYQYKTKTATTANTTSLKVI